MDYKIVMDSSGELPEELKGQEGYAKVPLTLRIDGKEIVDDGTVDQKTLLRMIAESPVCPQTACPSPEAFREACEGGASRVYVITISAALSGCYQSAVIGTNIYEEDHPDVKVHVFNSRSTSVGMTLILMKIRELEEKGLPFEEVVSGTEEYIRNYNTIFVLDNLETLRKNGRLSRMKAVAAALLKIKPVCYATAEGQIDQLDQARGINPAIVKMAEAVEKRTEHPENKILGISYCNCEDRAAIVRDELKSRMKVRDVIMVPTGGLSTVYSNDGGIIVVI